MKKEIAHFDVEYLQILDEKGNCDEKLMPKLSNAEIKKLYELMCLTREFDDKAVKLQRQGRIGTYASVKGQEACQIGSAVLFGKEDLLFPAFREHGVYLTRGMPAEMLLQYWGGQEEGMKIPKEVNVFTVSIPVGSHPLHAAGVGMAFKYQKKKAVAAAYFGDGATSEGDCLEAMNFAGDFKIPVIFFCQNNQYAISVPVKEQTGAATLAQKAIAFGFEGIEIDGNDVFAVYKATKDAIEKARSGKGPTFIECYTYRMSDHTTSDDSAKYRSEKEVKKWEEKDPIKRLEIFMQKKKICEKSYFDKVKKDCEKKIEIAVKKYEEMKETPAEEIFNYMYSKLTPELEEQKEQMLSTIENAKGAE